MEYGFSKSCGRGDWRSERHRPSHCGIFLTAGAVVAFVDTDKEAGEKIVSRFATKDVYFHHGDIAEEDALHAFAEAVKQRFGKVDYLVNNACISKRGSCRNVPTRTSIMCWLWASRRHTC